ncbi:MAG: type II secretion system protein M [Deltaproteobacteria bacterium]|nr:type II secretion system protein M [Deltaproteobacteria bacterium]
MSLAARFDKLSPREQRLLQVFGTLLGAGLVLGLPVALVSKVASAREHNADIRAQIGKIERAGQLLADRREVRLARDRLYGKPAVALASFIETAAKAQEIDIPESTDLPDVVVKGFVERTTQAKFRKVGLKALVSALEQMERSGSPVSVTGLHISARTQPDEYDVTLLVSQYEKKGTDAKGDGKKPGGDGKPKGQTP